MFTLLFLAHREKPRSLTPFGMTGMMVSQKDGMGFAAPEIFYNTFFFGCGIVVL
jgi:hypothetical protein